MSYQNIAQGALGGIGECAFNPSDLTKLEEMQRKSAARHERCEALRLAVDLLRGSSLAADHQAVIRAARHILAFVNESEEVSK